MNFWFGVCIKSTSPSLFQMKLNKTEQVPCSAVKRPSILGSSPGSQVENSFMKFDSPVLKIIQIQLCKDLGFHPIHWSWDLKKPPQIIMPPFGLPSVHWVARKALATWSPGGFYVMERENLSDLMYFQVGSLLLSTNKAPKQLLFQTPIEKTALLPSCPISFGRITTAPCQLTKFWGTKIGLATHGFAEASELGSVRGEHCLGITSSFVNGELVIWKKTPRFLSG